MTYEDFKRTIRDYLKATPEGATWKELKEELGLPYKTPCQTWINQLEEEIGLLRKRKKGNALLWELK